MSEILKSQLTDVKRNGMHICKGEPQGRPYPRVPI